MQTDLVQEILSGDPRALARGATLIERQGEEARDLLERVRDRAGRARVVGVTGPPGVGKSTLVDQLTGAFRQRGKTVGIVAVDPSSPVSGGAILGDRIRMQSHHADAGVFVRSMATRGALGGVARATRDVVTLLDAARRDMIFIETVGVGQAEVDVARIAPVTVVVLAPGMGDEVQSLKAGILEVASLFVINKADHAGADRLLRELHSISDRPVLQTVAVERKGIEKLVEAIMNAADNWLQGAAAAAGAVIDHLGIAVESIEEAIGFYRDQLGLKEGPRETVEAEGVRVSMLPVGESRIELLEASEPRSVIASFLDKRGEGLHHVALRVRDFEGTIGRLQAAGARLLNEPRRGAGGHLYVFVHPSSASGVLLELIKEE